MIPLSTSRMYLFNVSYKMSNDELVAKIKSLLNYKFPELTFKNIEIKKVFRENKIKVEIHFNHLFYLNRRTFDMETSKNIRLKFVEILRLIPDFTYEQIQLINDGFDRSPSLGLSRQNTK